MQAPTQELTVDGAREALELHVMSTRWLRRDLAKKLPIDSFTRSGSFHIVFRSFTETRSTIPSFKPYRGEYVDGAHNGPAPAPWNIPVPLPGTFINQDHEEPVPHTDTVKTCHGCNGDGQVTCSRCGGGTRVTCPDCSGNGRVNRTRTVTRTNAQGQSETFTESYTESCGPCGGDGRITCPECSGSGRITCPTCRGATRLKHYVKLCVDWKTTVADKVIEKTDLPDRMVAGAVGIVIHAEEDDHLEPWAGAAGGGGPYRGGGGRVSAEVNAAANLLIQSHRFPEGTKLHRQSLHVRTIPVYEGRYQWGKDLRQFWVYGTDQQVYAPNYPLSILRVGLAVGIPLAALGALVAFILASASPHYAPPPPRPAVSAPR